MVFRLISAALAALVLAACGLSPASPTPLGAVPRPLPTMLSSSDTPPATASTRPIETATESAGTVAPPVLATATLASLPKAPGLVAVLGETVKGSQCLGEAAFSPDGRRVALTCVIVRIWDVDTGALTSTMDNPYGKGCNVAETAFSPDSRLFVANIAWCWTGADPRGHVVVWDATTGELVQDVPYDQGHLVDPKQEPYALSAGAMMFIPGSSRLAYADGNGISIRDLADATPPVRLDLGPDMYASELYVSSDGKWLYAFMDWEKTNDFPSNYTTVYRAQVWDLATLKKIRQQDYPVVKPFEEPTELIGTWVVQDDPEAGTTLATDLLTGATHGWPFRRGWRYASPDGQMVLLFRYYDYLPAEQGVEVWATDTWRQLGRFKPDWGDEWYRPHLDVAFGPDPALIGIVFEDHLALWRLQATPGP